jgi:1-phosphatidylinositol-4-phosphate 5-kinase
VNDILLITAKSSLGPESLFGALEEVVSTGRSGSFLYRSSDKRNLLKTLPVEEALFLFKILQGNHFIHALLSSTDYYHYVLNNSNTLLTKFYGMHKIIWQKREIYFVVMANIFDTGVEIQEQYDLKVIPSQKIHLVGLNCWKKRCN